ncbi:hypothetical protein Fcan01_19639 [Folsomia candida]|uniref:Uncharacterized protein n=1 Tax=Folsomia candida TaxID=158441 RepID=A0A226DL27_FOLCA|nr:hypothetical protein Fcan01_19639 [Folsomia candida]
MCWLGHTLIGRCVVGRQVVVVVVTTVGQSIIITVDISMMTLRWIISFSFFILNVIHPPVRMDNIQDEKGEGDDPPESHHANVDSDNNALTNGRDNDDDDLSSYYTSSDECVPQPAHSKTISHDKNNQNIFWYF